jgi:alkenylglycerophosphocholine hydrolase
LKPLPVIALAAWAWPQTPRAARGIPLGLLVCAVGDVLLALDLFLAGVAVFMAAHLLYIWAFLGLTRRLRPVRAVPFLVWGAGTFALLAPVLGRNLWPVAIYMVVICAMMWRAAALPGAETLAARAGWWALAGALLFGASDTLLALYRFYNPWPDAPVMVMLLYWAGQACLARAAGPPSGISPAFLYHHAGPPAA